LAIVGVVTLGLPAGVQTVLADGVDCGVTPNNAICGAADNGSFGFGGVKVVLRVSHLLAPRQPAAILLAAPR